MPSYRVKIEAQATIEETWIVDAPQGVTLTEDDILDVMEHTPEGYGVRFIDDHATGDERDRTIVKVEAY